MATYEHDFKRFTGGKALETLDEYVKPPKNHIIIDFDIKDEDKSQTKNLSKTYIEFNKSGTGAHMHYICDDDITFEKEKCDG